MPEIQFRTSLTMIFLSVLLRFVALLDNAFVNANDDNACLEMQEISAETQINSSQEYTFPNKSDTIFMKNRLCSWTIQIPKNYFVILYINSSVPPGGRISVTQAFNHTESFLDSRVEVALFFVAPSFDLHWFSGNFSNGSIHFSVQWQSYPKNMSSQYYTLERTGSPIVLDHEDTYSPVVFHAATKVSVLCLPGYRREDDTFLRTGIVFDGPDVQSPFLGSLYSISQLQSQLTSSSSTVTIFSLVPITTHHHVIVQDASIYQNISQLTALNINESGVDIVKIKASTGSSAVLTLIEDTLIDEYLISVELENDAQLQIYFEGLSDNQRVATYTNRNNITHLPQKLQGRIRYYVLTSGEAIILLTRDRAKTDWEKAFAGRRGFFTSKYWKLDTKNSMQQDAFHFIGEEAENAAQFLFSYRVLEADLSEENSMHFEVADNVRRIHYYDHRSATEYTNDTQWHSHYGQSISVIYSTGSGQSSGFFAQFQIDCGSNNLLSLFIFCAVFLFWI